jgi:MarR family 2-MHQ and catechol resistance regulon transcriptional repressor
MFSTTSANGGLFRFTTCPVLSAFGLGRQNRPTFYAGKLPALGVLLDIKINRLSLMNMVKIYQNSGPHLFLLLWKASRAVMAFDQASIARSGFASLSDFGVLEVLLHKGSLPVNAIGEKVLLTSGSITTAVQRLEKKGLVRRERSGEDARVVLVHLTEAGRSLIESAFTAHAAELDQLFAVLDDSERSAFAELMRKLGQRAESLKS